MTEREISIEISVTNPVIIVRKLALKQVKIGMMTVIVTVMAIMAMIIGKYANNSQQKSIGNSVENPTGIRWSRQTTIFELFPPSLPPFPFPPSPSLSLSPSVNR